MNDREINIETHGEHSPGVVYGDYKFTQNVIHQYNDSRRKHWKKLDTAFFMIPNEDMLIKQQICKALLITLLHRTYKESGYTNFVGLFGLGNINYKDKIYYGHYLVSHHSKYIGALKTNIRYLINNGHSQEERDKQIDSILNELKLLMIDWTLNVNINYIGVYHPLEFIYQPDLQSIKIGPPEIRSENPTKYVKNVRTTSEFLTFFSSTFHHSGITHQSDL